TKIGGDMLKRSPASCARGDRRSIGRALLIGIAVLTVLCDVAVVPGQPVDPDFSSVSDILDGRRHLLRADDLVIGQIAGFSTSALLTSGLGVQSQTIAPVVSAPCGGQVPQPTPFQTRVGRLFNLDHDVVVSLAPLATAGPGCAGTPNMAFYIQDPRNAANDSR